MRVCLLLLLILSVANADNRFYTSNRAPLAPSPLIKLPIGAIQPQGWLRTQLQLEADGFSGHLSDISQFCKYERNGWVRFGEVPCDPPTRAGAASVAGTRRTSLS